MSRKPPKLVAVPNEGKSSGVSSSSSSSSSQSQQKVTDPMPPLKQVVNVNSGDAGSSAPLSTQRRSASAPKRNFLNCNGSTANNRRRFPAKFPLLSSSKTGSTRSSVVSPESDGSSTANGCLAASPPPTEAPPTFAKKLVNGTISNGDTPQKPPEPSKLLKRSKSLNLGVKQSQSSGSDSQNSSSSSGIINGKKVESVSSRNSASSTNSQPNSLTSAAKRTSRLSSQSSSIVAGTKQASSCAPLSPSPVIEEEKCMPALVAYEGSNKETPADTSSDSEEAPEEDDDDSEPLNTSLEPKIIRQGDTVIKSYVDEKTGKIAVFEKGMKLEVRDFGSSKTWYPAKVIEINKDKQEILVHYSNWSSRFDEWISMKSSRLRPSKNTNVVRLHFNVDERVEAVWPMDSKKYYATIKQVLPHDMYEVTFDDGIKMKRSANQIFKVSESEAPPVPSETEASCQSEDIKSGHTPTPKDNGNLHHQPVRRRGSKMHRIPESVTAPEVTVSPNLPVEDESTLSGPNRPAHFSVFDLPQGDLGKRRRTVHDYSVLVKGRLGAVRTPRRPKSDGHNVGNTNTESGSCEPVVSPVPAITTDSGESATEPTSRRRKSGSVPLVSPPIQPLNELSKEAPTDDSVVESQKVEPIEPSSKKRKHATATVSLPSTSEENETLVTTKPTVLKGDMLPTTQTEAVPSTKQSNTTSRRAKSLGNHQVVTVPPFSPIQADVPKSTKVDSGFVDETGNEVKIEQADDGFWKCPLEKCGKNFRKDSLLKMHFKHYHPELKVTRGIANVVQMAQARTAFDNYPSEHHSWEKLPPNFEQLATESVPSASENITDCGSHNISNVGSPETPTPQTQHKRSSKASGHHTKDPVEKISPTKGDHKSESRTASPSGVSKETKTSPDSLKPSKISSRLRLDRKRIVVSRYGRLSGRSSKNKSRSRSTTVKNESLDQETDETTPVAAAMDTESNKKLKLVINETADTNKESTTEEINNDSVVISPTTNNSVSLSTSTSPRKADHTSPIAVENCAGSNTEPFLVSESEPQTISGGRRTARGRWSKSKSHIRRGLINSNIRRVGSSILQNPTALFIKKRNQIRKFMGKRGSRQRKTSILNRISSGRMRVILEALNQRSLKRRRFKAARRFRDVKVDVINCICNNKTEFGLMIQCELCLCWQHGSCFNVQSNSQLPEYYACQSCAEPQNIRFSRKYEWAESEFYKLGKLPSFPFGPCFPKEDARVMKQCTNLTANLTEAFSMIKGIKLKERICFGNPVHPQLYQWNSERPPPQEEIQRDRFEKYFKPVLRRLLLENKSDPTYKIKLKTKAETRIKLRKYSDAVESARSTLKKKLGCRAAAFLGHICDGVLNDMIRAKRKMSDGGPPTPTRKEVSEAKKRVNAENAYFRLRKMKDEITKSQCSAIGASGIFAVAEDKLSSSSENGTRTHVTNNSHVLPPSPIRNELTHIANNSIGTPQQSVFNSVHFSTKGAAPYLPNGVKRDIASTVKDLHELKKYLKEKRTVEDNINVALTRMAKEFPEEWKNLMKISRGFVDERREKLQEVKLKWISNVIVTYNNLRILLRQIYSEDNSIKQRAFCSEFEKTTIRLFDLIGIGLTEERLEAKKHQHPTRYRTKTVRGLETLDMLRQASAVSNPEDRLPPKPVRSKLSSTKASSELDDARKEILRRLGMSTKPLSGEDVEDLLSTDSETRRLEDDGPLTNDQSHSFADNKVNMPFLQSDFISSCLAPAEASSSSRKDHDQLATDFTGEIQLIEAVKHGCCISPSETNEVGLNLSIEDLAELQNIQQYEVMAIPSVARITPEVCKKNLVRDILLQQQQIDLYLDKIEGQVIKLCSQSRTGCAVSSLNPSQLSSQRDKLRQSLDLVLRLSKTVIGENDMTDDKMDNDSSDCSSSDSSDTDTVSDSDDDDNASNFSGTDTETADEGDDSGNDDILDV